MHDAEFTVLSEPVDRHWVSGGWIHGLWPCSQLPPPALPSGRGGDVRLSRFRVFSAQDRIFEIRNYWADASDLMHDAQLFVTWSKAAHSQAKRQQTSTTEMRLPRRTACSSQGRCGVVIQRSGVQRNDAGSSLAQTSFTDNRTGAEVDRKPYRHSIPVLIQTGG